MHPFAPSLAHPAAQSAHFMLPAELMHCRLAWHPPLSFAHSLISGQANVCIHDKNTRTKRFLFLASPSRRMGYWANITTPLQPFAPSLSHPAAQSPQLMLPAELMHLRWAWHSPLFFKHSFTSSLVSVCTFPEQHVLSMSDERNW